MLLLVCACYDFLTQTTHIFKAAKQSHHLKMSENVQQKRNYRVEIKLAFIGLLTCLFYLMAMAPDVLWSASFLLFISSHFNRYFGLVDKVSVQSVQFLCVKVGYSAFTVCNPYLLLAFSGKFRCYFTQMLTCGRVKLSATVVQMPMVATRNKSSPAVQQ